MESGSLNPFGQHTQHVQDGDLKSRVRVEANVLHKLVRRSFFKVAPFKKPCMSHLVRHVWDYMLYVKKRPHQLCAHMHTVPLTLEKILLKHGVRNIKYLWISSIFTQDLPLMHINSIFTLEIVVESMSQNLICSVLL